MIRQLIKRLTDAGLPLEDAVRLVITSDPLELVLHMEQVWDIFDPWAPNPKPAGPTRRMLWGVPGVFDFVLPTSKGPHWDHLGYSYIIENTRAVQIIRRVVREYRSGEGLGIPSVATQRWLDVTEPLLFGALNPVSAWLTTSALRQDPEEVRRNAYWRLFGLDLAFGTDDNRPSAYDKATSANTGFVQLFEELLFELWQSLSNLRNTSGVNQSDDDRIFRLSEALQFLLRSRRQNQLLAREELGAATALGWIDLTLSVNTPVVIDLQAEATSPGDRLRLIGQRVGLPAHSKSSALLSMSAELSVLLRTIESGIVSGPQFSWILYLEQRPTTATVDPIGADSKRVITEWAAATGKDLKARASPVEMRSAQIARRPQLVASR